MREQRRDGLAVGDGAPGGVEPEALWNCGAVEVLLSVSNLEELLP